MEFKACEILEGYIKKEKKINPIDIGLPRAACMHKSTKPGGGRGLHLGPSLSTTSFSPSVDSFLHNSRGWCRGSNCQGWLCVQPGMTTACSALRAQQKYVAAVSNTSQPCLYSVPHVAEPLRPSKRSQSPVRWLMYLVTVEILHRK